MAEAHFHGLIRRFIAKLEKNRGNLESSTGRKKGKPDHVQKTAGNVAEGAGNTCQFFFLSSSSVLGMGTLKNSGG